MPANGSSQDDQPASNPGHGATDRPEPDGTIPLDQPRKPKIKARKPTGPQINPDLSGKLRMQGSHVGDRYVRVIRQNKDDLTRVAPGYLVASEEASSGRGPLSRRIAKAKRILIGAPLTTASAIHERLTKVKALAVLSSDALSSVAYATEEILRVLVLAGLGAMSLSLPIGAAIVMLLIIVGFSYRQTIKAYPHGGGSYIVAKDNLGETPALVAGGALLVDYILTVAVSISAAVAAMVSAVPELHDHLVLVGLAFVIIITVLNLRGIRESGSIFAVPTYLFLVGIAIMLIIGFVRNAATGFEVHEPDREVVVGTSTVGIFLILRAFASGCAALTGVEAISDGVPAFKPPEWKNARTTLTVMIAILAVTFSGITFLAHQYGAVPLPQEEAGYETVVSQIARGVFGGTNAAYYYIQFATMSILVLAANTAYSDFPRLSYFMARDRYMPSQFTFRGDRLAYTTGIITLGVLSATVLAIFGGETERLIPLYAVGVFTSFTLSQFGMVMRWQRRRGPGWRSGRFINALGAVATGIVAFVVAFTKFTHGAWMVIVLIPVLVLVFKAIHRHYDEATSELAALTPTRSEDISHVVVVPIAALNRVARQTLAYARSISDNVTAIHISDDEEAIEKMRDEWNETVPGVPLVIIESPYRSLVGPLLTYLDEIQKQAPQSTLTVVLPEYIPRHWWEQILHNQTALRIKAALLFRPGTVVTSVPYHLERAEPLPPHRPNIFMRRM
ncbi:MAG TPA: APC family permease [Thermomicrobiales bacterium]|nr:APC family permease [Thermomicrobiales bacterium]